ncbi:hypothetical protein QYE76_026385 [Lolium multiflorum]|uniref:Myb/SANT-like domain-containing protein n=1 Tax=Lolium multiflorum TaxID=4521 RepID=A0AAD8VXX3_LOLMU|nr:hypothetical protein QYE76_026385 [Lolium multiflorum]
MDGRWRGVGGDDGDDLFQFPIPAGCQNGVSDPETEFRDGGGVLDVFWLEFQSISQPPLGMAEPVEEILDDAPQPKKAAKIMTWTPPMSACLLKCLAHIAAKGVKTDKGFKEVHITKAAKDVTQLVGYEVTTTQVTNHLRKWKTRWQKIDKLRTLSGALWNDDEKMIVLADQHYLDHTQDHKGDVEFLNTPLLNYEYMEACFANKLATGKFAMGSNEALGKPIQVECPGKSIDLESGETNGEGFVEAQAAFGIGGEGMDATTPSPSSGSNKKRKRASMLSDEDSVQVSNMSDALRVVAGAINNTCHAETHPDLCKTVMDLPGFEMDHKLAVLDYLTEHKGKGLNFMKMEDAVREAAFKRIIAKNPDLL